MTPSERTTLAKIADIAFVEWAAYVLRPKVKAGPAKPASNLPKAE